MSQPDVFFSTAAQAMLAGHMIRACYGVKMELESETVYLCQGDTFTDNVGQVWRGLGQLGGVNGVQCGAEAVTAPLELTISGVMQNNEGPGYASFYSALSRAVADSNAEILGGTVEVYWLLFNQTTAQAIDLPYLLQTYQMGSASLAFDGGSGSVTLSIPADPLFGGKHIPPLNLVSDADQQARYPGDKIFERIGWKKTVVTF
jgi:hypothetical protein